MSRVANAVIIVHGSHTIRAGIGIHELFKTPSIELTARVGLTKSFLRDRTSTSASATVPSDGEPAAPNGAATNGEAGSSVLGVAPAPAPLATDYLVGAALDEAERSGEELEIYWPMRRGIVRDWQQIEALWRHILFNLLPVRRSRNESHVLLALPAPVSRLSQAYISQIFFERFNSPGLCLVEKPLLSSYAAGVLSSVIVDLGWEATSVVPVIDCAVQHSAAVQADVGARHCTLWLAHLLRQDASIVKALEALAAHRAGSTAGAGSVEERLQEALVALATQLVQDGHIRTPNEGDEASGGDDEGTLDVAAALVAGREKAVVEEQARRKAAMEAAAAAGNDEGAVAAITGEQGQAGGSTDASAVLVDFRGLKIKVGPSRFRYAEPLLDPSILASVRGLGEKEVGAKPFGAGPDPSERIDVMEPTSQNFATAISVPEAVSLAINACELERRPGLWENLVITGASTRVRGLGALLLSAMARFVASAPTEASQVAGEPNPLQAHNVRALRVPDYFAEFKERTDLAPFLGATIHAKLVFGDPFGKSYISKQNYNHRGPAAIFAVEA